MRRRSSPETLTALLRRPSGQAGVGVLEVLPARDRIALRAQIAAPGSLLVTHGAELPDAERRPVLPRHRPGREGRVLGAGLRPDGLPQLVLVAPARDQEEV